MTKRPPSERQLRAVEIGADELAQRLEWAFRGRPRKLRALRKRYREFCARLLRELEKGAQ